MSGERIRAIGLVSGGLDSQLAVALMKRQGIEVLGLHFYNGLSPGALRRVIGGGEPEAEFLDAKAKRLSGLLDIAVEIVDISGSEEFLDILVSPRHGYGANVNPCIDCRIFMLRNAKKRMEDEGYRFIFTGEVLGQRPMSQNKQAMDLVERRSGLEGFLLRPLSAALLKPTVPEHEGWIDRGRLLDIQGRSRRRQMALMEEWGLGEFAQPAGGCTLTEIAYAGKFKDLMAHRDDPRISRADAVLLAVGRHFRLGPRIKIIVGRDETENNYIERAGGGSWMLTTAEHPGPTTLVQGEPGEDELLRAASITARYSDAKRLPSVRVGAWRGEERRTFEVAPIADEDLEPLRI